MITVSALYSSSSGFKVCVRLMKPSNVYVIDPSDDQCLGFFHDRLQFFAAKLSRVKTQLVRLRTTRRKFSASINSDTWEHVNGELLVLT